MTSPATRDPRAVADDLTAAWLEPLHLTRGETIAETAIAVAARLTGEYRDVGFTVTRSHRDDHAYVDLQPGDGTAYRMHITLLTEEAERSLGYRLVIAMPAFGVALALDAFGMHYPDYIGEKAPNHIPTRSITVIAAFTTLLSAHLDHLLNP